MIALSNCDHVAKVVRWSVDTSKPSAPLVVALWGCTECDETFNSLPESSSSTWVEKDHTDCDDTCFACKARSLKVAYCGIGGGDATTQKKWDRGIEEYRAARAQGIQPKSTKLSDVRKAVEASNKSGSAVVAGWGENG